SLALPCLFDRLSRRIFNKNIEIADFSTEKGAAPKLSFCNSPFRGGVVLKRLSLKPLSRVLQSLGFSFYGNQYKGNLWTNREAAVKKY
ncbi:hypothetical protein, partial [Caproicibacter sp.]|uniref:hypothetical protein n=1 Tax=Caproicibacter sp. TaxID=2814884 RepID=UPI003989330E